VQKIFRRLRRRKKILKRLSHHLAAFAAKKFMGLRKKLLGCHLGLTPPNNILFTQPKKYDLVA
jgi:hypothetical protein